MVVIYKYSKKAVPVKFFVDNLFSCLGTGVGHQSHKTGVFDGGGHLALVLGAEAGSFAGDYLELPRGKLAQ